MDSDTERLNFVFRFAEFPLDAPERPGEVELLQRELLEFLDWPKVRLKELTPEALRRAQILCTVILVDAIRWRKEKATAKEASWPPFLPGEGAPEAKYTASGAIRFYLHGGGLEKTLNFALWVLLIKVGGERVRMCPECQRLYYASNLKMS